MRRAIRSARCSEQLATREDVVSFLLDLSMLLARQERLTLHVAALRRLLAILSDPDRTLPIILVRLGTSTRVYSALWDSGSQGDFIHPRVVKEARLPTTGSQTPISVTLGDDKTQRFFDQTVSDLPFFLTLEPTDRPPASRRRCSSAHFDVMETGYNFILGTPWSRRFRNTEADWATNTLVLKMKCGQTYRVSFIGTTATPLPDPPPPEPSVPTPSPSITVTSPRLFAHFIRQDDVTFFMENVTDLLHYDSPCPDAELILLEPDPTSISMAPISIFVPPPSVESTPSSRADADAEELARYTADLEPAVRDLIREYHDVFPSSFSYAGIPPMRDVEHSIQLVPDYHVHHQAPYRLSIPEATELKRQLKELLRLGFIKPSNSPWGAPLLFVRKADGTLRLCIDYRGLNRYTVKNSYPMPRSDELFDCLAGNRFFTKIDLRSGYHQIRIAAADQPKTAFRLRFGHYEFTVMPFGLTNAPATFQRAMNDILRDILEQYVLVYLDDILVYSRTLEEHLRHLRDVLDCLRRHGFYAKLSKCRFAQQKVEFFGHYLSDQGLHMDDAKITAIAEWPAPTSAKQFRSFLGLTSYYSNFIRGYVHVRSSTSCLTESCVITAYLSASYLTVTRALPVDSGDGSTRCQEAQRVSLQGFCVGMQSSPLQGALQSSPVQLCKASAAWDSWLPCRASAVWGSSFLCSSLMASGNCLPFKASAAAPAGTGQLSPLQGIGGGGMGQFSPLQGIGDCGMGDLSPLQFFVDFGQFFASTMHRRRHCAVVSSTRLQVIGGSLGQLSPVHGIGGGMGQSSPLQRTGGGMGQLSAVHVIGGGTGHFSSARRRRQPGGAISISSACLGRLWAVVSGSVLRCFGAAASGAVLHWLRAVASCARQRWRHGPMGPWGNRLLCTAWRRRTNYNHLLCQALGASGS
ncbi:hypothetical protein CBR_g24357 [Chara braunii]|uniref:Reverse transcriptase domain-containing protein n=1 Tax=Chara braunii TaxID=69332 RepID=A0A388JMG4_CHABU|nr:hypothetical protein CBR_g24357 [Chara braunii]|eukprot:GBG59009.1 hypothetical protein CBR_g24357 [Chara braunii]